MHGSAWSHECSAERVQPQPCLLPGCQDARPSAIEAPRGTRFCCVTAGPQYCVAVTEDGNVFSWGDAAEGQLGHDIGGKTPIMFHTNQSRRWCEERPVQIEGFGPAAGVRITEASAGGVWQDTKGAGHTVFIDHAGRCWSVGWNKYGQLGRVTTVTTMHGPTCMA